MKLKLWCHKSNKRLIDMFYSHRFVSLFSNQEATEGGDIVVCMNATMCRQLHRHPLASAELQDGSVSSIVAELRAGLAVVKCLDDDRLILDQGQPWHLCFFSLIEEGKEITACNRGFEDACWQRKKKIIRFLPLFETFLFNTATSVVAVWKKRVMYLPEVLS